MKQQQHIGLVDLKQRQKFKPSEALAWVRENGWDVSDLTLQRTFNWTRSNVRTFRKKHAPKVPPVPDLPPPPLVPVVAPAAPTPKARLRAATAIAAATRWLFTALLLAIAVALAQAGLRLNYRYALTLAPAFAPDVGPTIATVLVCYDAITIILPTIATSHWRARKYGAALVAWLACIPAVVMTLYSSANFVSANVDEGREGRRLVIEQRRELTAQLEDIRGRAALMERRPPAVVATAIETALQGIPILVRLRTRECTDITVADSRSWCNAVDALRKKKDEAAGRLDLERQAAEIESRLAALPPIVSVNPGGETLSSAGLIPEHVGTETQKGLLTGGPLLAGILIWLAF